MRFGIIFRKCSTCLCIVHALCPIQLSKVSCSKGRDSHVLGLGETVEGVAFHSATRSSTELKIGQFKMSVCKGVHN